MRPPDTHLKTSSGLMDSGQHHVRWVRPNQANLVTEYIVNAATRPTSDRIFADCRRFQREILSDRDLDMRRRVASSTCKLDASFVSAEPTRNLHRLTTTFDCPSRRSGKDSLMIQEKIITCYYSERETSAQAAA